MTLVFVALTLLSQPDVESQSETRPPRLSQIHPKLEVGYREDYQFSRTSTTFSLPHLWKSYFASFELIHADEESLRFRWTPSPIFAEFRGESNVSAEEINRESQRNPDLFEATHPIAFELEISRCCYEIERVLGLERLQAHWQRSGLVTDESQTSLARLEVVSAHDPALLTLPWRYAIEARDRDVPRSERPRLRIRSQTPPSSLYAVELIQRSLGSASVSVGKSDDSERGASEATEIEFREDGFFVLERDEHIVLGANYTLEGDLPDGLRQDRVRIVAIEDPDYRSIPFKTSWLSAHNCYPDHGKGADRIERALGTGLPIAIEQDLCWVEQADGAHRSVISHNPPFTGDEPTLREHFFERVRPLVEAELKANDPSRWPVLVLDLDVKNKTEAHYRAIHQTLRKYEDWLCRARKADGDIIWQQPIGRRPIMVIIGGGELPQRIFHDELDAKIPMIAFGTAAKVDPRKSEMSSDEKRAALVAQPAIERVPQRADNFHRVWNDSWHSVEAGGATRAGDWTDADNERLKALVHAARRNGYWLRLYVINGSSEEERKRQGWSRGYNTGTLEAAKIRWRAMRDAGVDFIASDQYELLREELARRPGGNEGSSRLKKGTRVDDSTRPPAGHDS